MGTTDGRIRSPYLEDHCGYTVGNLSEITRGRETTGRDDGDGGLQRETAMEMESG